MENVKRVAVYIRVSTANESQENSIVNQRSYFQNLISRKNHYELVDYYADEGKSGKTIEYRYELQRMLSDCEDGKIDLVLAKSISRFARNTVDLLRIVDKLTDLGVEIRFDQENISTFDTGVRFILTVLASLAEQESKSISENIKWSVKKIHEQGKTSSHIRALGYGWDSSTKNCYVIEQEAELVRCIYAWFSYGYTIGEIVKKLNMANLKGIRGSDFTWQSVNRILHNPLYRGKLRIGNEILQGRHEAIIPVDDFLFLESNRSNTSIRVKIPPVYCAYCDSHMRRLGGHYRAKGREYVHVYRCIKCDIKPSIPEDEFEVINKTLWGINYKDFINEKVRKYSVGKENLIIHLVGSNKPYVFTRDVRFRGKKVFK